VRVLAGPSDRLHIRIEELDVEHALAHESREEHIWMLGGRVTLCLAEDRIEMEAGDFVSLAAGPLRSLVNESDAPCRYLVIGERAVEPCDRSATDLDGENTD
jgi:uncharacterized cupin superfamily protein